MAEKRRVFASLIFALLVLIASLVALRTVTAQRSHQRLAAQHLLAGRGASAEPHLAALRGRTVWLSAGDERDLAKRLFARGAYADFLAYDDASREFREGDESSLYRAEAQLALHRIGDAESTLRAVKRGDIDPNKLDALTRAIAERKQGSYPFIFDRSGKAIAAYDINKKDVVVLGDDFTAFVETIESKPLGTNERIETTLDSAVQQAAVKALGSYRASLVAIDPRTNEVLAVASVSPNRAFERHYEPGSVIKVLTLLAALANGVDVAKLFPYECTGALKVDGRSFGDWRSSGHGKLADIDDAMAQSCNVVFADVGIRTTRDGLQALHRRAGFDGQTNLGLFRVPLGRTVGEIFNNFETGFYSIGLEHETVTTFHLAMIASALANRGALTTPRIYRARRSIVGEVVDQPPKQTTDQIAPRAAAEAVIRGMQAVVMSPRGTGRRAKVEGVSLALKTGTSGTSDRGYDALLLGFAPVDQPKIAFALIGENAGPAEVAAAKIARDFIEAMRASGNL